MFLEAISSSRGPYTLGGGFIGGCVGVYLLASQLYGTTSHTRLCWGGSCSPRERLCIRVAGFTAPSARALEVEGINTPEY